MAPVPVGSRYHIFSAEMPNTSPFGATQLRGYHQRLKSGPNASRPPLLTLMPVRLLQPAPGVHTSGVIDTLLRLPAGLAWASVTYGKPPPVIIERPSASLIIDAYQRF